MGEKLRSWVQRLKKHPVLSIGITVIVLIILGISILLVVSNGTGFDAYSTTTISKITSETTNPVFTSTVMNQPGKTLWDLLQLLIIPMVIAGGGFWFSQVQNSRQDKATERRAQVDHDIALDNQREARLQEYFDKMSELVFSHGLLQSKEGDPARIIARARTLSVVRELDPVRKGILIQFLYESFLILSELMLSNPTMIPNERSELKVLPVIIPLKEADLSGAELSGILLIGANLEGANLSNANLSGAFLWESNLESANLSGANLSEIGLTTPLLFQDVTKGENFSSLSSANLTGANLSKAYLNQVNMSLTILNEADLSGADLTGVTGITSEELEKQAKSLKGATMPDGSKHP